jgi:hypothetical protein
MRLAGVQTTGMRVLGAGAFAAIVGFAVAQTTIDPGVTGNRYGWGENVGWINLRGDVANGVRLHDSVLSGFAWGENIGWINFGDGTPTNGISYSNASAGDFGVNFDPSTGELSGYAWGENIGWVNFDGSATGGPTAQVKISLVNGVFSGYAWGENIGWLGFNGFPAAVAKTTLPSAPVTLGDINNDGVINVADVTELANLLAGGTPPSLAVGDVNNDGNVNDLDVTALALQIVD